jgi:3-dehydroquinate synthase II
MRERVAIAPEAEGPAAFEAIVARARRRGFRCFLLPGDRPIAPGEGEEILRRFRDRIRRSDSADAEARVVVVDDPSGLDRAIAGTPDGATLVLEWSGDRVIPLENAVAGKGRRFALWTIARSVREAPAALGALEHGADRVIVTIRAPSEVEELEGLLERTSSTSLEWAQVTLRSIEPVGLGDRVLVDTTSLLAPEEGLLVGSVAALLFHVASEAVGSAFSRPRPFRVNAGAAHSYVLLADGTTRYLSELVPGDGVLVTAPAAQGRAVRVGRVKVERRPMVLLRADDGARERTLFLQEAETVRVSTASGRAAVTELAAGASLFAVRLPAARHLGTAVEETIEER